VLHYPKPNMEELMKYVDHNGIERWGNSTQIELWRAEDKNIRKRQLRRYFEKKNILLKRKTVEQKQKTETKNIKEQQELKPQEIKDILTVDRVVSVIQTFRPSQQWNGEEGYHAELQGYLKVFFKDARVEVQRGSSRPDIVINDIAIEVKGPTYFEGLQSIADKCIRYTQHFHERLIVVLFDVKINDYIYQEWLVGMNRTFPLIKVIRLRNIFFN